MRQFLITIANSVFFILFEYYNKQGMDKSENKKFPYKSAKFVDGKRPYVEFWIWDNEKKKLVRKRTYKDANEELAKEINDDLKKFNIYVPSNNEKLIKEKERRKLIETSVNALQLAFDNAKPRLRKRSVSSYKSHLKYFFEFLNENYPDLAIRSLQASHVTEFLNTLQQKKGISNKTRNSYGTTIGTLLSDLKVLGYVDENVMEKFKKAKVHKSKAHQFYNIEQRKKIKEVVSEENSNLWLVCQILFYTFVRPQEIRFLKVGYIETDTNKLFIPAEISKNKKSERVDIPSHLMNALLQSGFLSYHSDYYLFGINGFPSNKPTKEGQFTKEYKEIKDRLKLSKEYTLYSWKHTGVVAAYKSGVDVLEISQQCRHHNLEQTRTYMRGLGVYSSEKIRNNFPSI